MAGAGGTRRREVRVQADIRSVRRILLGAVVVLTTASLLVQLSKYPLDHGSLRGIVPVLDSTGEASIPTFLSAIAFLGCSVLMGVIAASERGISHAAARPWWGLSVLFFVAAFDEAAEMHEYFGSALGDLLAADNGFLYFFWVVPGAAFVLLFALYYRPLFLRLSADVRRIAGWGAGLFVAGALGLELAEGRIAASLGDPETFGGALVAVAQEALEMVGLVLLLEALLRELDHRGVIVHVGVGKAQARGHDPAAEPRIPTSRFERAPAEPEPTPAEPRR
jgi:hypothetical protein